MGSEIVEKIKQEYPNSKYLGVNKMLKMKKILGILLALCFVLSVTAATASAAPSNNHDGKKNNDNHYNNGNHYGKTKHYKQGYWGHKKIRHHPDRHHKSYWYTYDRCWYSGYWYWR